MWVATGHAGIHRYRNGAWTWYQPMTRNGPGFYEVRSMALDAVPHPCHCHRGRRIVVHAAHGRSARVCGDRPPVRHLGLFGQARRDPRGGLPHQSTMVVHYDPVDGFVPVLTGSDLAPAGVSINDIAAAPDGRLFIATDNGMYIWKNGGVADHLGGLRGWEYPRLYGPSDRCKKPGLVFITGLCRFLCRPGRTRSNHRIEMVGSVPAETLLPEPTAPVHQHFRPAGHRCGPGPVLCAGFRACIPQSDHRSGF